MKTKMSVEEHIFGVDYDKAARLHKIIQKELDETGVLDISLAKGAEIHNIKSIGEWGDGFYYGKRENQQSFTKSISVFWIKKINGKVLAELLKGD